MKCYLLHRKQDNTEYFVNINQDGKFCDVRKNQEPFKLPLCHIREGEIFELTIEKLPNAINCRVDTYNTNDLIKFKESIKDNKIDIWIDSVNFDKEYVMQSIEDAIKLKRYNILKDFCDE